MKKIIALFYRCSVFVRILIVTFFVLSISVVIAASAIYQLGSAFRLLRAPMDKTMNTGVADNLKSLKNFAFFSANSRIALVGINEFGSWIEKNASAYLSGTASLTGLLSSQQQSEVEILLTDLKRLSWIDVMETAVHPINGNEYPDMINFINSFRFLADFTVSARLQNAGYPVVANFAALIKISSLPNLMKPTLIGKLFETTSTAILNSSIRKLMNVGQINASEAAELLVELHTSEKARISFTETIRHERTAMTSFLLQLQRNAPLGFYIVDRVAGDPLDILSKQIEFMQHAPTTARIEELGSQVEYFRVRSQYRLAVNHLKVFLTNIIAYGSPNQWISYWEDIFTNETRLTLIKQELAVLAGLRETFRDPFTGQELLSKVVKDKKIFYSAGANQKDDGMSGDDIY